MEYKALTALFEPMRSSRKKAIANRLERAHGGRMSEHVVIVPMRRSAGHMDMTTRSRRETVHFKHPFRIKGIDRLLPAGAYEVVTDEEMIEGLSFPCFRRVATIIMVPGESLHTSSME